MLSIKIMDNAKKIAKFFKKRSKEILAIYHYGSYVSRCFSNQESDYDFCFILDNISGNILSKIRKDKQLLEKRLNVKIGLTFHTIGEMETIKRFKEPVFVHRNRYFFFVLNMKKYGVFLCGRDILPKINYQLKKIQFEALRVMSTILYDIRKIYVNKKISLSFRETIKYAIYSPQYYFAFKGLYPVSTEEAFSLLSLFKPEFTNLLNNIKSIKNNKYICDVSKRELIIADIYNLIEYLYKEMLNLFNNLSETKLLIFDGHEITYRWPLVKYKKFLKKFLDNIDIDYEDENKIWNKILPLLRIGKLSREEGYKTIFSDEKIVKKFLLKEKIFLENNIRVDKKIIDFIKKIKTDKGTKIIISSDTIYRGDFITDVCKISGLFNKVFTSNEIKREKDAPSVFKRIVYRMKEPVSKSVFIGHEQIELAAAKKAGLITIYLKSKNQPLIKEADFVIKRKNDLNFLL